MPPSGHGSQDKSAAFRICPRSMGLCAISTDFDGAGRGIGAAAVVSARCEASQTRAIIVVPPARTRATISRITVRARMAFSMEMRENDDDQRRGGDRDTVG